MKSRRTRKNSIDNNKKMRLSRKKLLLASVFAVAAIAILATYTDVFYRLGILKAPASPAPTDSVAELQTETLQNGYGSTAVKPGDLVAVNYVGSFEDGSIFDSSLASGKPFEFYVGKGDVIKGWDEGLLGMRVGEKRRLVVPPALGYGDQANGSVPANSTLVFEIDLLEIK